MKAHRTRPTARAAERTAEHEALDARKSKILEKIVSAHIATGQPIGSAQIVRDAEIDVSPATVRSDMASLERDGYLSHPYTSAGRVPTDLGYRFFVDNFSGTGELDPASEEKVQSFFGRAHGELERMLRDTSQLLSQLTDHAAVVIGPTHEVLAIRSALLACLGSRVGLLVVVLSNGAVEKHAVELSETLSSADIEDVNATLREHLPNQTLGRLSPAKLTGRPAIDEVLVVCHHLLSHAEFATHATDEVYIGGTARTAEQFPAVDTVRELLSILEQSFVVVSLLHEILSQGQSVSIGTENTMQSLSECSLVVAPYRVGSEHGGTIGILGPTRMNYPQALAAVAVVSKHLGTQLASG